MKKNNKGFFLAETIVVIALVTTIMAFVYPNVSNLYDSYNNRTKYYDQTEDLYLLRAFSNYLYQKYEDSKNAVTGIPDGYQALSILTDDGCDDLKDSNGTWKIIKFFDSEGDLDEKAGYFYAQDLDQYVCNPGNGASCVNISNNIKKNTDLKRVYIVNYMATPTSDNYNFNRYLRRMKKTSYDITSYRLIGVFSNGTTTRYASIKIDNPNPTRNCNLGGE